MNIKRYGQKVENGGFLFFKQKKVSIFGSGMGNEVEREM